MICWGVLFRRYLKLKNFRSYDVSETGYAPASGKMQSRGRTRFHLCRARWINLFFFASFFLTGPTRQEFPPSTVVSYLKPETDPISETSFFVNNVLCFKENILTMILHHFHRMLEPFRYFVGSVLFRSCFSPSILEANDVLAVETGMK